MQEDSVNADRLAYIQASIHASLNTCKLVLIILYLNTFLLNNVCRQHLPSLYIYMDIFNTLIKSELMQPSAKPNVGG